MVFDEGIERNGGSRRRRQWRAGMSPGKHEGTLTRASEDMV